MQEMVSKKNNFYFKLFKYIFAVVILVKCITPLTYNSLQAVVLTLLIFLRYLIFIFKKIKNDNENVIVYRYVPLIATCL